MDYSRILTLEYWRHFIKFNVVGLVGVVVNEGLLALFIYEEVYYLYADALAIEISILTNFLLNDFWTFRDRRHGHILTRLGKFNGLMLIGLVVNVLIVYAFTTYTTIHPDVSNLFLGIPVASLLRYWLSVRFAWIKKEEKSVEPPASVSAQAILP